MNKEELQDLARQIGFKLFGVANPSTLDIDHQKAGFTVKSVIVLAIPTFDSALDACLRIEINGEKIFSKWIYEMLGHQSLKLCLQLHNAGFQAKATRSIDLLKAGVEAGLGSIGANFMLLNKTFGPHIRLIAILTDLPLETDKPDPWDHCIYCYRCVVKCPGAAVRREGFVRENCLAEYDPTPQMAIIQQQTEKQVSEQTRIQCHNCMSVCPVGRHLKLRSYTNVK